jgi:hypothetical protein
VQNAKKESGWVAAAAVAAQGNRGNLLTTLVCRGVYLGKKTIGFGKQTYSCRTVAQVSFPKSRRLRRRQRRGKKDYF